MVWEFLHCFGGQEKLRKQNFMTFSIFFLCCMLLFSRSAHSCTTLWPHRLQPARLPCPSLSPGVCSNSCSMNQWCHQMISLSVTPFSSCLQSLPASGSFPMSQLFASGGQSIGASASASVLPMFIQWFPLEFTDLILLSKGLSRVLCCINKTIVILNSCLNLI